MKEHPIASSNPADPAEAVRAQKRVRLKLEGGGELHIDRPLPFIFAYDPPASHPDAWTSRLLRSEASTWFPSSTLPKMETRAILEPVLEALVEDYGTLLVIELRARSRASAEDENRFLIGRHSLSPGDEVLEILEDGLKKIRIRHRDTVVDHVKYRSPPGAFVETMGRKKLESLGVSVIHLGVPPIYIDENDNPYPLILKSLRRQLVRVLRRTAHGFAKRQANRSPTSYLSLGRSRLVQTVVDVDRRLDQIASEFDYLMLITPTNVQEEWERFQEAGNGVAPRFRYRPIPIDPGVQKRRLYEIPIERIADPALAEIFEDRRYEFDVRLAMLQQRGTRKHLLCGLQLYGEIDATTRAQAELLLKLPIPPGSLPDDFALEMGVDAGTFARRAREEFKRYRKLDRSFSSEVKVRGDLGSVLVSRGKVYVDRHLKITEDRLEALIAHEVGTHVVTFHNGAQQPLGIFSTGLAGYEELQEGLAVLGEFLVGGLTLPRLRQLAGRVVAAQSKLDNASFIETFRLLNETHQFSARSSFMTAMRAHRGGGSLKDVIYLRGLARLLGFLRGGGDLNLLFLGKIAQTHVALVQELLARGILVQPALIPNYLTDPLAEGRLEQVRSGVGLEDMISPPK